MILTPSYDDQQQTSEPTLSPIVRVSFEEKGRIEALLVAPPLTKLQRACHVYMEKMGYQHDASEEQNLQNIIDILGKHDGEVLFDLVVRDLCTLQGKLASRDALEDRGRFELFLADLQNHVEQLLGLTPERALADGPYNLTLLLYGKLMDLIEHLQKE